MTLGYDEINARLTAPGEFFEIEERDVGGIATRTWKNAPRSLREVLAQGAAAGGTRPFLVLGDERLTHAEHASRVATFARALVDDLGVQHGDRVVIAMRNYPEWSIAFFATTLIGAVAVPLNAWWTGEELAFGVRDSGARVLIADGERLVRLAPHLAELAATGLAAVIGTRLDDRRGDGPLPDELSTIGLVEMATVIDGPPRALPDVEIDPEDEATIFYTSGTTGTPKGVLGTQRNICSNLTSLMYVGARGALRQPPPAVGAGAGADAPRPQPVTLVPVPLFHATGCHSILVAHAYFGGTLVLMRKWDPQVALRLIERERVTGLSGVPSMMWELVQAPNAHDFDLSSLTTLGGGGAAAPPEIVRKAAAVLPGRAVSTGYGLTETSSLVTSISGADYAAHPDSVGVPVPVCGVRVIGDDGTDVPAGAPGELWISGPNVVKGYWRRPDETAATFVDGWLRSGDLGRIDDEGFVYILDRIKDIIIRGGENVAGAEVEAALFEHPDVLDVAAIGIPHDVLGEEVGVVVCLRPGAEADADALRAHVAARLAGFKVPTHVWIRVEPLPRNPAGKVMKRELRTSVESISAS